MIKQPNYEWHENGIACCTLFYNNLQFKGVAYCHPDDEDMMSKLTGQIIAEYRATIQYLRHIRDNEIQPQLKALWQLYYSMKHSKQFTPRGYEARMLYKQIQKLQNDLNAVKEEIAITQKNLKEYIDDKEKNYQAIRKHREGQN